jgi:hypothetical protein
VTVLELAPDHPRWVEARALLLAGAPVHVAGGGFVVESAAAQLCVVLGDAPTDAVLPIVAGRTVLAAIEREDLAGALAARGFAVERALLHTLPDPDGLPDDDGIEVLPANADLAHLPAALADELRQAHAQARPIHAAWVDGLPASFAYAPWRTERWFDVSVDTVREARQLGLASRTAAAMIRAERALGREPVWGAAESNAASLGLAARLGFVEADALWLATPRTL